MTKKFNFSPKLWKDPEPTHHNTLFTRDEFSHVTNADQYPLDKLITAVVMQAVRDCQSESKSNPKIKTEAVGWMNGEGKDWCETIGIGADGIERWMLADCPESGVLKGKRTSKARIIKMITTITRPRTIYYNGQEYCRIEDTDQFIPPLPQQIAYMADLVAEKRDTKDRQAPVCQHAKAEHEAWWKRWPDYSQPIPSD